VLTSTRVLLNCGLLIKALLVKISCQKIDNIKEETTQDMENLRKKNETELQNKTEGQSSRTEQTKDRISELEDEMEIKGKNQRTIS
jgi:vesicle coat complex subunit